MEIARQIFSVVLVFALLGAALWAFRRGSPASIRDGFRGAPWRRSEGRTKSLQLVERLALSPQHSLHLIEMDGRQLLLAVHPQGCTLLHENAPQEKAPLGKALHENAGGTAA